MGPGLGPGLGPGPELDKKFSGGEWVVGGRPNLMLAQVLVFCPGPSPGQDLTGLDLDWTWNGPGMDLDGTLTLT